ncbi:MAG TPA: acetylglutamate kinase [Candidatus Limnocylindria bacterium]|nr:acetylglutamate kinase [Candidatus Limnocylindria bacterium]
MDPATELTVLKLGGTTLAEQRATLAEVAALSAERQLVVVHGGGKRLTDWLERLSVESRFEGGLRVTDDDGLEVALAVLGGLVNGELVAALRAAGADAVGLTGVDGGLLVGRRNPSLGRVATVTGARPTLVYALLAGRLLPVVAPLALDESGVICNVNADDAAAGLAGALHARLVLLTDVDGVRDAAGRPLRSLDELAVEQLITDGVIHGGMLPKVRGALAVLRSGGSEVVIADGGQPEAVRRALDDPDFGTRIRASA